MASLLAPEAAPAVSFETFALVEAPTHSFLLATEAGEGRQELTNERVQYNPVFAPNVGVGFKLGTLKLESRRKMAEANTADRDTYGSTSYTDVATEWRPHHVVRFSAFRQHYRGFYTDLSGQSGLQTSFETDASEADAEKPSASADAIPDGPDIQKREDMSVIYEGGSLTGALPLLPLMGPGKAGQDFPPGSSFDLVVQAAYTHVAIQSDESLIPYSRSDSMASAADVTGFRADGVGLGGGLEVDIPFTPGFRFAMRGIAGSGKQRQRLIAADDAAEEARFAPYDFLSAGMSGDWHGERSSFMLDFYVDSMSSHLREFKVTSNRLGIMARYAYAIKDAGG